MARRRAGAPRQQPPPKQQLRSDSAQRVWRRAGHDPTGQDLRVNRRREAMLGAMSRRDLEAPRAAHDLRRHNRPLRWCYSSRARKNDWMDQGASANIHADEDEHPLCVVRLFNLMRAAKPSSHLSTGNSGTHVFTLPSGKVLRRGKVEEKLRQAAQQLDIPAPMVSTRSLRAGGATAMWDVGCRVFSRGDSTQRPLGCESRTDYRV